MKWSNGRKWRSPRLSGAVLAALCLVVGVLLTLAVTRLVNQPVSPLPASIHKEVTFTVFVPMAGVRIDGSSFKYDKTADVLSFTGTLDDGQTVTFAEQSTPDPFTDIPDYTTQFLQTLFEYQAFGSLQGVVYLTHPKGAGQAAVMNAKGTLLFARVARDEDQATWQRIFAGLTILPQ